MQRRRTSVMRIGLLIAAAASGASAASPAHAAPGADVTVAQKTFTVADGARGAATAACPRGTRVVSGGVGSIFRSPFGSAVQASGPLDSTGTTAGTRAGDIARRWYASVANGRGAAQSFRVFALCSATSDAVVASTTFTPQSDSRDGGAAAKCPAGRRAVGGGLGTTAAAPDGIMQVSGPLDETGVTLEHDGRRRGPQLVRERPPQRPPDVQGVRDVLRRLGRDPRRVLGAGGTVGPHDVLHLRRPPGVSGGAPRGRRWHRHDSRDRRQQPAGERPSGRERLPVEHGRRRCAALLGSDVVNYGSERTYKVFALCASEGA